MIGGKLGIPEIIIMGIVMMGFLDFLAGFGVLVWNTAKIMVG